MKKLLALLLLCTLSLPLYADPLSNFGNIPVRHVPDFGLQLSQGKVAEHTVIHVAGHNEDVGTGIEDLWDGGGTYTYSSSTAVLHISSSSTSDTEVITVEGLDASYNAQSVDVTLAGQTETVIGTGETFIRVLKVYNAGTSDLVGAVYVYEDDTVSVGVPATATLIRAKIDIGHNQTLMSNYTIPAGKTGYISHVTTTAAAASKEVDIIYLFRPFGKVFRAFDHVHLIQSTIETRHPQFIAFPAKTDFTVRASASATGGTVSVAYGLILIDD